MIQVILNIAVVTNTIPNTGITLPFVSYGGTSVLFLLTEIGLVLNVSHLVEQKKGVNYEEDIHWEENIQKKVMPKYVITF